MSVLFLGPFNQKIEDFFREKKIVLYRHEENCEKIPSEVIRETDFIVSYGYRYIIPKEFIEQFPKRAINLHISYLPWNRGADPNLWSFLEDTPKGVTIHYLTEMLDKGDILFQKQCYFDEKKETLRSSYEVLKNTIENLLMENWDAIYSGDIIVCKQLGDGSYHKSSEKERFMYLLSDGWDTPVWKIIGKALL